MRTTKKHLLCYYTILRGQPHTIYQQFKEEREQLYPTSNKTPFAIYWAKTLSKLRHTYGYTTPNRRETQNETQKRVSRLASYTEIEEAKDMLRRLDIRTQVEN